MARTERNFSDRDAQEQRWLVENTWCDSCAKADLGLADPIEFAEDGQIFVEGKCVCTHELVTSRNIFVGQVCHIEAANPGGQRFNQNLTDEQRRSFENLLLLCYRHHKETDDVAAYDANALRAIKHQHESKHGEKPFKVNESFLHRLESEMQLYWNEIASATPNFMSHRSLL